jgi:hypothetical protein
VFTWHDDSAGDTAFLDYARQWLEDNPRLGARSRATHERNLRLHLAPLAQVPQGTDSDLVRGWYSNARRGSDGTTSVNQAYRLLRAILNTAVREGAIVRNPCQFPGAGAPPGQSGARSRLLGRSRHFRRGARALQGGGPARGVGRAPPRRDPRAASLGSTPPLPASSAAGQTPSDLRLRVSQARSPSDLPYRRYPRIRRYCRWGLRPGGRCRRRRGGQGSVGCGPHRRGGSG